MMTGKYWPYSNRCGSGVWGILLLVGLFCLSGFTEVLGVNLVANPGWAVQGSSATKAQGWEDNVTGGTWGNSERSNWNNHDGDGYSDLVKGSWGGNTYGGSWQKMAVTGGSQYELSAWFYTDNGWAATTWQLKIEWYDSSNNGISSEVLDVTGVGQGTWVQKMINASAPANAASANVVLDVAGINSAGAMYMDDLNFHEIAAPSGWGVQNGGIEDQGSSDTDAAIWGEWGSAARRSWNKRSGSWAMGLQPQWSGFDYGGCWQAINVTGNVPYTVTAYFLRDSGWTASSISLKLEWYDATQTFISENALDLAGLPAWSWEEKVLEATAPANAAVAHLVLSASGIGTADMLYMDDVSIAAGQIIIPDDLCVYVDADEANRPISDYIYGLNIANWAAGYYLDLCTPKVKDAGFTVIRYGATNIERYNYENNRLYNVISKLNQYVPVSWESFVDWCIDDLEAEPLVQISAFGHVAGEGWGLGDPTYDHVQTFQEVSDWIDSAGSYVKFWQIGNEPMIAWKRSDYPGHFADGAHGDQILNQHMDYEYYFPRFAQLADTIKDANEDAIVLGPTPANWWLYWSSDYSPECPVTTPMGPALPNDPGWSNMLSMNLQWTPAIFPCRGGDPGVVGWETDTNRFLCQFATRMAGYESQYGQRLVDYMDVHRYMNCWNDRDAINEPRGLYEDGFQSWDQETGCAGTETKLLKRFQNIIDSHYPGTELSFSEYDFFYWNGYPSEFQVAALGQMDYLGFFAKMGVQLACNWYMGEPDQSGGAFEHASDAAKQAMFNEEGEPNPKYWVIWMMSRYFNDTVIESDSGDWDKVSVHACKRTNENEVVVFLSNKGAYDEAGELAGAQPTRTVDIVISNAAVTGVKKILRFGEHDPYPVEMDLAGITLSGQTLTYDVAPLAVYAVILSTDSSSTPPSNFLHVNPRVIDFGPYETGSEIEIDHGHTNLVYTHPIKISNARNGSTAWTASESCSWLSIVNSSGNAEVTDQAFLLANKAGLGVGVHETTVTISTSEGDVSIPVSVEVIPGEAGGEKRICDFETGSLAHTWGQHEPYSVGWWDFHGNPGDRNRPYIYDLSLDHEETSRLGGLASMKVEFNRANGDLPNGKMYAAFGTYGHTALIHHHDGPDEELTACADWSGYDVLLVDIKTKTEGVGPTKTQFLMVIKDDDSNAGKPNHSSMTDYKDMIEVEDGVWQTIAIPLSGVFYDWGYPNGQDGSTVVMNFESISQIEFVPWAASDDKAGVMWIDNIRLVKADPVSGNDRPTAIATQDKNLVNPGEAVQLTGSASWDGDGAVSSYRWAPTTGLSNPNIANPTFSSYTPGEHVFELIVTDNDGAESRNVAQVNISVLPSLSGQTVELYRDAQFTDPLVGNDSLEVYVKLTATSGGNPESIDYTLCTVSSTDPYTGDLNNDCADIEVMLVETAVDSKTFTGMFKVGAFSDDDADRIGCAEGYVITVASSDGLADDSFTLGKPWYGRWVWVDRVESDLWTPNHFEGFACAYDDAQYTNNTLAYVNYDDTDAAHPYSTKCLKADVTLDLGASMDTYRLFGGIACTLNPFDDTVVNFDAAVDIRPDATWTKGVSFWLKGNGKMLSVVLKSEAITDYDDYVFTLQHTPNQWRRYYIPLREFSQEGWGTAVDFDTAMQSVEAVQFKASSKIDGEYSQFYVDDVALFGGCIDTVEPLVHWACTSFPANCEYTFEPVYYNTFGWAIWGQLGARIAPNYHYEGAGSFFVCNYDPNGGYWLGALVPNLVANGLQQGEPNVKDWSDIDGIAIKTWREPDPYDVLTMTNSVPPDGSPMRIRMVVSEDTNAYTFANAGVTRWHVVDSTQFDLGEGDYIFFAKDKFYTESTVDLVVSNDTLPWVQWDGNWANIQKYRIEFGGTCANAKPHPAYVDDLKTYQDNGDYYPCPW
ncbi:MAG: hypothetical protein EOM20_07325 [Spartobacteria bacterium]|nr:hypothetical protein [Spartobacteria bacterium]